MLPIPSYLSSHHWALIHAKQGKAKGPPDLCEGVDTPQPNHQEYGNNSPALPAWPEIKTHTTQHIKANRFTDQLYSRTA